MIVFSSKEALSGGKSPKKVRKLTADTVEEWHRLLQVMILLGEPGLWWSHQPTSAEPWAWGNKLQVAVWCRVELMPKVVQSCDAVQVPEGYWQLCAGVLQREMWKLWTLDQRDDDDGWEYWRRRVKWLAGQVFRGGWYVADPEAWDGGDVVGGVGFSESGAVRAVKTWNAWIEKFDLAQRRRVNPANYRRNQGSEGDERTIDGVKISDITRLVLIPEERRSYFQMSPEQRAETAAAKPWTAGMFKAWEAEYEGGTLSAEGDAFFWTKSGPTEPRQTEYPTGSKTE